MKDKRSYSDKLKDGRWQLKRIEVMRRDNMACCECHRPASCGITLNVHHRFYKRVPNPWDYELNWLETLCEHCHERREDATLLIHTALLPATTGELILWAKRIDRELGKPKRKLAKQAKANKQSAPFTPPAVFIQPGDKTVWESMRAAANGLIALAEMRGANAK